MKRLLCALPCLLVAEAASAQVEPAATQAPPSVHLTRFGAGPGPAISEDGYRLLDRAGTRLQSNAVAFDRQAEGARATTRLRARLRVLAGGDGGAFLFLNTAEYGARGPAPFLASWVEPNLRRSFAVAIDVHNPLIEEPFGEWGNYQGLPEREVSLHWDGRELVKRTVAQEFRGDWAELEIDLRAVCGGSEVSVRIGESAVYERHFVSELLPYESRLAFGAGTREEVATQLDVAEVALEYGPPADAPRPPLHVELFNHVLTDNSTTSYQTEVDLPPADWAFGRIVLTLEIHDAGDDWDEWDRNGHLSIIAADGSKWDIVPFITSYRTECHWMVDVSHFRPWLSGRTRFEIAAGTTFYKNRGYMMSAALDYHHGVSLLGERELEPYRIEPLWVGTARHGSADDHFSSFFTPVEVSVPEEAAAARVFTTTTGHSQVGEFTPSARTLVFSPDRDAPAIEERFADTLWRADCFLNPNRPQFGTWKYSRAGWAPGDVVHPWWVDLTPHLQPGRTALFRYLPEPYDFSAYPEGERPSPDQVGQASHVVRSYLILYRPSAATVPAPVLRVTAVTGGSSAAQAGIQAGDYLASYAGVLLDSVAELGAAKQAATEAGEERVAVVVYRGSERLELEIATGQLGVNLSTR